MTFPAPWVRQIVEEEWGKPFVIGHYYMHPEDGPIKVIGGRFWGDHGLSNHWTWTVLKTGEQKSGYGGELPDYTDIITPMLEAQDPPFSDEDIGRIIEISEGMMHAVGPPPEK